MFQMRKCINIIDLLSKANMLDLKYKIRKEQIFLTPWFLIYTLGLMHFIETLTQVCVGLSQISLQIFTCRLIWLWDFGVYWSCLKSVCKKGSQPFRYYNCWRTSAGQTVFKDNFERDGIKTLFFLVTSFNSKPTFEGLLFYFQFKCNCVR